MSASTVLALAVAAAVILGSHCELADSVRSALNPHQHGTQGTRPVLKTPGVGSSNETLIPFDDLRKLKDSILRVHSITIASFNQIDSIQFTYVLKDGSIYRPPVRGEGYTVPQTIKLAKDEYVAKIEGTIVFNHSFGQVYITIKNPNNLKSRVYGRYGANVGQRNFTFEGYILGIHGKIDPPNTGYNRIVRNLGVYQLATVKESEYFGGIPLLTFYENPDTRFPPVVKVSKMFISHDDSVYSLQAEYQYLDGTIGLGGKYGGDAGNLTTISLEYGEELSGLKGKLVVLQGPAWEINLIGQITFITRKKDGSTAAYGPFGRGGTVPISVDGHILGFSGSAPEFLASLGVFYYV